jgi:uncharacterized protein
MSLRGSIAKLSDRFYDRMRSPAANDAANGPRTDGFDHLRHEKYCLLVTYRRSGQPVPTPVWFGLDHTGRLYTRSTTDAWKVKRIHADPRVLVAPCDVRGIPLGPATEARARVVPPDRQNHAERSIQANYRLARRLYGALSKPLALEVVYLEISPT